MAVNLSDADAVEMGTLILEGATQLKALKRELRDLTRSYKAGLAMAWEEGLEAGLREADGSSAGPNPYTPVELTEEPQGGNTPADGLGMKRDGI